MKVLSVASEAFPLVKTGGLADVVGALPAALARHGVEMRVLVPAYPSVLQKARTIGAGRPKKMCEFASLLGAPGRLLKTRIGGADFLLLDMPDLFDRPGGPYAGASGEDHADNWRRFAALSRAAASIAEGALGWIPDVVHAHDWQAALTPLYLAQGPADATPSVITIHNLAFQGRFGAEIFEQLGLPSSVFSMEGLEYYGDVSFLKGGIHTASAVTTVSPTYAQEIRGPEFGMGLDGVVNARADDLYGIVNGIDTEVWNPETDPLIPANFSSGKRRGRAVNRRALVERFGLDAQVEGPVFTLISRLTWQKGIDVLIEVAGDLVAMGGRLAVLGSGERTFEEALQAAARRHPGRIGIVTGYDEPLSHLMQAGGDAILVPSRFEPCGLTQLCGLRYGSVPVVTHTGGLADTVIDANEAAMAAGVATGFQFSPLTADTFRHAIRRTIGAFSDRKVWERLQHQGMTADVSWDRSGLAYARLYRNLVEKKK